MFRTWSSTPVQPDTCKLRKECKTQGDDNHRYIAGNGMYAIASLEGKQITEVPADATPLQYSGRKR